MINNVVKECKSIFKSFSKLHIGIKSSVILIALFLLYNFVYKSRVVGYTFMNSLGVTENFSLGGITGSSGGKSLVYYRMEGCPHCMKFDADWETFESTNNTSVEARKVDSKEPECKTNGVSGFPTILLTDSNKAKIKECPTRDVAGMIAFCKKNA